MNKIVRRNHSKKLQLKTLSLDVHDVKWKKDISQYQIRKIGKMTRMQLHKFLTPFYHHYTDTTDEFDWTYDGINAQHALTRLYRLQYVSDKAPKNWAWQLVGVISLGFSGVTRKRVHDALIEMGWSKYEKR